MADLTSQISEARSGGYSDDQIIGYLGKSHPDLAPKIQEAQSAGYSTKDILGYLGGAATSGGPTPPAYPKPANPITNPLARAGVSDEQAQKFAAAAKRESAGDLGATLGIAGAAVPGGPLVKGIAAGLGQLGGEAVMGQTPTTPEAAATMALAAGIPLLGEVGPAIAKGLISAIKSPAAHDAAGIVLGEGRVAPLVRTAQRASGVLDTIKQGIAERASARAAMAQRAGPSRIPLWNGVPEATAAPEAAEPIASQLPSGRIPGPAPAGPTQPPPPERVPLWKQITVKAEPAPAVPETSPEAQAKLVEIKAGVAERAKARAASRAKVTARAKPAQPTPITQPAPEPEPVAAAAAPAPAPGRPVAVPEPDDLSAQLQASIDAVKKNGKPASNAPVPSTAKNAAADEDLKAKAGETTAAIVDRERTRRALAIGRFVKEHIPEEDIPNMTDEHFRSVAPLAGIENPSSDTIGKVRELLSMGRGR